MRALILAFLATLLAVPAAAEDIPHLERRGEATPLVVELGPAMITATTIDPWTARDAQDPSTHGAVLIWLGGEDYPVAGQGVTLTIAPADRKGRLGFDWVEEGRYENGQWLPGRRLNGDQTHQGRHVRLLPGPVRRAEVPALPVLALTQAACTPCPRTRGG